MSTLYVDNLQPNLGSRVMAAGHVVQVVSGSLNNISTSSQTYSDLGSLAITPTASSSKILILFENHMYIGSGYSSQWKGGLVQLLRDTNILQTDNAYYGEGAFYTDGTNRWMTHSHRHHYDSPNTTNSITYKVQGASRDGTAIDFNNLGYGAGGRITLMEIAQ